MPAVLPAVETPEGVLQQVETSLDTLCGLLCKEGSESFPPGRLRKARTLSLALLKLADAFESMPAEYRDGVSRV